MVPTNPALAVVRPVPPGGVASGRQGPNEHVGPRRWCRPAPGWWRPSRRRRSARPPRAPGRRCAPSPWTPPGPRLTRRVVPVWRSRTNTSAAVGVARHQVGSIRLEGDEPPVRRERRVTAVPLPWTPPGPRLTRRVVPLWRSWTNTSGQAVGVARHQVGGIRLEGDEAPVRRERRGEAVPVALDAARPEAHAPGRARLAVADEHVDTSVGVARHQVGGIRAEGDEPPVRRERRLEAEAIALDSARPEAHAPGRARLAVADEHVGPVVGVARHQVGGQTNSKATKRPSAEIAGLELLNYCPGRRPARGSRAGSCPSGGRGRTRRRCRWCRPAPGWWRTTRRRRTARPPRPSRHR